MIKVLIERKIQFGEEQAYDLAAQKMLSAVLSCQGYVSSEQLFVQGKSNHRVIITKWRSVEDWNRWAQSAPRFEAISFFEPLLTERERVLILQY